MRNRRLLGPLNKALLMDAPLEDPSSPLFLRPKAVDTGFTIKFRGVQTSRTIIYLRSDVGCAFGLATGGCLGCRHWRLGTAGRRSDIPEMYLRQYLAAVNAHGFDRVLCVYNEGNVLNPEEIPTDQLIGMLRHMAENGVERLITESRPEYINETVLTAMKDAAGPMEIEIGIGLESANDLVRDEIFLKAMPRRGYEKAVGLLSKFGMRSLTYAILKPPFLNEAQAIEDTVATIEYAFLVGSTAVSVEPIGVEPHTVTELMYQAGVFRPAWLWSSITVARRTANLGEVRIGGIQFAPRPTTMPANCATCSEPVLSAIEAFNGTQDLGALDIPACECILRYEAELRGLNPQIDEARVREQLRSFVATQEGQRVLSVK